ncbi:MAG TPA: SBBP repeat-containing protein, partial [Terriglobia bacterium]|nr:SBBP repeat-containing protein [Terriglobia bacterium]
MAFSLGRYPSSATFAQENTRLQKHPAAVQSRPHDSKPVLAAQGSGETGRLVKAYGKLPLSFEANQGQTDPRVKFLSRGAGYAFFLTGDEAVLALEGGSQDSGFRSQGSKNGKGESPTPNHESRVPAVLRMKLLGANASAQASGLEELPGKSNYFIGNDPQKWRTDVPNYGKVRFADVYPGIDLVYYGNQGQLEYDWVFQPGADPRTVRFAVSGADKIGVSERGDLEIQTATGTLRFLKPVVYQEDGARAEADAHHLSLATRHSVDGRFVLLAKNQIGFRVAKYDQSKPLVIDPVLSFSTFLGGSDEDWIFPMALDASDNIYVSGNTVSTDFPTTAGVYDTTCGTDGNCNPNTSGVLRRDTFVTKMNSTGTSLVYSTFLGGSGADIARGLALDSSGNAYVTGYTLSADFPTTAGAYSTAAGTLFVTKLNSTGTALV